MKTTVSEYYVCYEMVTTRAIVLYEFEKQFQKVDRCVLVIRRHAIFFKNTVKISTNVITEKTRASSFSSFLGSRESYAKTSLTRIVQRADRQRADGQRGRFLADQTPLRLVDTCIPSPLSSMAKARVDVRIFACVPIALSDVMRVIHRFDQCELGVAGAQDVSQANLRSLPIFGSI